MTFQGLHFYVGSAPFVSKEDARYPYDFLLGARLTNIQEFKIPHGSVNCYMVAVSKWPGEGSDTAVDFAGLQLPANYRITGERPVRGDNRFLFKWCVRLGVVVRALAKIADARRLKAPSY